jgi:hypothetical protein
VYNYVSDIGCILFLFYQYSYGFSCLIFNTIIIDYYNLVLYNRDNQLIYLEGHMENVENVRGPLQFEANIFDIAYYNANIFWKIIREY